MYSLPAGNPVVTGTTISSTVHNNTMSDIASALTDSLAKDGQTVLTGALDFNGVELILDVDGDSSFHADTDDQIDVKVGATDVVRFTTSGFLLASGSMDLDGAELVLDADGDTSITADTDDQMDFKVGGTDRASLTSSGLALASGTRISAILDEDDFASDSETAAATQQSIKAYVDSSGLEVSAEQATTSGSSVTYGSIGATVKRIMIAVDQVSPSGTADLRLRIGDSGGIEASGYNGGVSYFSSTTATTSGTGAGFFCATGIAANTTLNGIITLALEDAANNVWSYSATLYDGANNEQFVSSGRKALTATLTQLSFVLSSGTFDGGGFTVLLDS